MEMTKQAECVGDHVSDQYIPSWITKDKMYDLSRKSKHIYQGFTTLGLKGSSEQEI